MIHIDVLNALCERCVHTIAEYCYMNGDDVTQHPRYMCEDFRSCIDEVA